MIISLIILLGLGNMSWKYLGGLLLIGKVGLFVSSSSSFSSSSRSSPSYRYWLLHFLDIFVNLITPLESSRDLSCSQSEYGHRLTTSPTIHRIDLEHASCILSVKSSRQGDGVKSMEVFLKFRFLGISKGC